MGERVIPPACVAALRDYSPREAGCPHWLALKPWQRDEGAHDDPVMCDWCAPAIARAVLDAFVAGEVTGPWRVECETESEDGMIIGMWWAAWSKDEPIGALYLPTEAQARAVAAVLNYLEAKGE